MSEKDLSWFPVDLETLPAAVKPKYAALVKANAAQKDAKAEFEAAFLAAAKKAERIDTDVQLAFGYRFGRLAVAKVDATAVKKDTKPKFSF